MELINVSIYEPHRSIFKEHQKDRAECRKFFCSQKDSCDFYKEKTCINVANFIGPSCRFGKVSREDGFTQRARKYSSWISGKKKEHKHALFKLKTAPRRIAKIGDCIFLPYAHMDMNKKLPLNRHSSLFVSGSPFIPIHLFTDELILDIVNFRPEAMMGGEIKSYQKDVVPKFLQDLKIYFPDIFNSFIKRYPEESQRLEEIDYVGRAVFLSSLRPGVEIKAKDSTWKWDGEFLESEDSDYLFPVVGFDKIFIRIKPKDGEKIKVTDNSQIDENTKFAD